VRAHELESTSNWSGAVVHPDLVAHLDATALSEHEDGTFSALDLVSSSQLMLETEVPVRRRGPDGQIRIQHEAQSAIHWPFLADSVDWRISEEHVAASFTSFGRSAVTADIKAKRDETIAFMRRAKADLAAISKRRLQR
jgi:hypothetical protein